MPEDRRLLEDFLRWESNEGRFVEGDKVERFMLSPWYFPTNPPITIVVDEQSAQQIVSKFSNTHISKKLKCG